jgi:hypothetical protein
VEQVFASVAGGNLKVTCLVNRTENNYFNRFSRIYACYDDDRTSTPPPTISPGLYGSIGRVHKSHNGPVERPDDFTFEDDVMSLTPAWSDADQWFHFPNISGFVGIRPISASSWRAQSFYYWYLEHLPRYAGHYASPTPTATANQAETMI